MLSPLVESDEDDNDDDASFTALGLTANGSNATKASTTALGSPANVSNLSEGGDATDAGSNGNERAPADNGAIKAPSIAPMQQSSLFPIFRQVDAQSEQSHVLKVLLSLAYVHVRSSFTTSLSTRVLRLVVKELLATWDDCHGTK
jgi:hypothetical protein